MALYRKYRPASFAEVVGQEQVTTPLSKALDSGHINHAYLFSGPRGCGKTSSARILARSLNCAQGPTSTPCGVCDSCVSLAPGGPGNLDVMELDAASHNGVEDMRELRDRAIYAPAESRYRVFIIDEAHMITTAGSNALLKIVEEPPAHLIFIFATTEPEKVIGTIRSRTHHYPFRLLAPPDMRSLAERIVAEEGVQVDPAVYPLVIQAGGGSPRDTLSILDQLLAGAGDDGLSYDEALPLLGVTDLSLLDDAVDALGAGDAAALFSAVGRVVDSGHEPRRFAEDLLDRLRDLMILQTVPNAIDQGLVDAPTDRAELLHAQAHHFPGDRIARLAHTVNDSLKDMRGATSQRLMLEIACARMLVDSTPAPAPAATSSRDAAAATAAATAAAAAAGFSARDQKKTIQREETKQQAQPPKLAQPTQPGASARPEPQEQAEQTQEASPVAPARPSQPAQEPEATPRVVETPQVQPPSPQETQPPTERQAQPDPEAQASEAPTTRAPEPGPAPADQAGPDLLEQIRDSWAQVRREVGKRNRVAEIMLTEARVLGLRAETLVLGHNTGALAQRINAESNNTDIVAALKEQFDRDLEVHCVIGTDPTAAGFEPQQVKKNPTWNPHQQASARQGTAQQTSAGGEETPDSSDDPARPTQPNPSPTASPTPSPEPSPTPAREPTPANTGASEPASDTWGAPARIPGQESGPPPQPAPQREQPRQPQPPKPEAGNDWRAAAAAAAQRANDRAAKHAENSFSSGIPLPPEPEPDFGEAGYPPPDDGAPGPQSPPQSPSQQAQQQFQQGHQPSNSQSVPWPPPAAAAPTTREEEETMMVDEAQQPGERDRRDATAVAFELLESELGARRL